MVRSSAPRNTARRHLDAQFSAIKQAAPLQRPRRGWVRAIRDALGMSSRDLAHRMGVSQPSVTALEQGEVADTVQLGTLRRAAAAMDCELVYLLLPRVTLDDFVTRQALTKAERRLGRVDHHMALEDQALDPADRDAQLVDLARELLQRGRGLWTDAE